MYEYLGTDIRFDGDFVVSPTGDLALISGLACLAQDLRHRLMTPKGSLWCHPEYGVDIYRHLQLPGTEVNRLDLLLSVREALEDDPRVDRAEVEMLAWARERIQVRARAYPRGMASPLSLVAGFGTDRITVDILKGGAA
ncbi:MAG: GPW/gp25 family protein [Bacteroidota bacterium]